MPELPEVETIARCLARRVRGRMIRDVRIYWSRTVAAPSPARFRSAVRGARIARVFRRGKHLAFEIERGRETAGFLVSHLRMSGCWLVSRDPPDAGLHVRALFELDGGLLSFVDPRKFGRLWHVSRLETLFARLGPEPLGREFTIDWLARALRARKRRLKPLLLDQTFIAGLGNIYVDESLHNARLHPLMRADRTSVVQAHRLHGAIRRTLRNAIRRDGSSFDVFYRTPEGRPGRFQSRFRVYGRAGEPCPRCGVAVRRIVVAQRGTHVCPRCQPSPRGIPAMRPFGAIVDTRGRRS
ncbi:MAG: bifunctional DNA-formamidopyrimidine glycosylase/DNA-(apurinic or apyrimidinic site) lyase [Vicinamibacteria bacterium]|nr:bifunctional DNA-formamidopyrimidine glycosylase/DNA-(apurinic or apyrimidinic site) lyase [Vicinamibacteria bacterium]